MKSQRAFRLNGVSVLVAAAVGLAATGQVVLAQSEGLKMRGVGETREKLDALQYKAFDATLWSHLKDWTTEFRPESASDKVVMIVTWSKSRSQSHGAMKLAQDLSTKYADKGLVVVGVHNPNGSEHAAAHAKELGVKFPIAVDVAGKFRAGLRCDADPNVYFIDRAGQLRFAQVDPASAEAAVEKLLGEGAEQAKGALGEMHAKLKAEEEERFKTKEAKIVPLVQSHVEFEVPGEDEYNAAKWPFLVGKIEYEPILEKLTAKAPKVTIPEDRWLPGKPDFNGRLIMIYVIDPTEVMDVNVLPIMNNHAIQHQRDMVVVGTCLKYGLQIAGGDDQLRKMAERNTPYVQQFIKQSRINHSMLPHDVGVEDLNEMFIPYSGRSRTGRVNAGFCYILSTDLKIRWAGNPYAVDVVNHAVRSLADVDPGVKARRQAEASGGKKKKKAEE